MKEFFQNLSEQDKINVYCRMNEIKAFGQETFWQETGCHPEESYWTLVTYAMRDEQLITEEQYRSMG